MTVPAIVFLDAQVFEAASFNYSTKPFVAFQRHLESGRLRLVITDITIAEVRRRIEHCVTQEIAAHKKFCRSARVLRSSPLAEVTGALVDLEVKRISDDLQAAFDAFLKTNKAEVINATVQEAGRIFEKYFGGQPPFGSSHEKKNEFPDAFVTQALIEWTESSEAELFVVSGDKLFVQACTECADIHGAAQLADVLDRVASDDETLATFIRTQVVDKIDAIKEAAKSQFEDLSFHVKDESGDVDVEVVDIELEGRPDILEIEGSQATVQMTFKAYFDAHLSYDDSDTAVWDHEEGEVMYLDHIDETVKRVDDLVVQVRVILAGMDPTEFEVEEIELVDPSRGYGITTSKMEGYPWK